MSFGVFYEYILSYAPLLFQNFITFSEIQVESITKMIEYINVYAKVTNKKI